MVSRKKLNKVIATIVIPVRNNGSGAMIAIKADTNATKKTNQAEAPFAKNLLVVLLFWSVKDTWQEPRLRLQRLMQPSVNQ